MARHGANGGMPNTRRQRRDGTNAGRFLSFARAAEDDGRTLAGSSSEPSPGGVQRTPVTASLRLAASDGDAYEVTAIDAGSGNGWEFPPAVLAASVALWQRVNVYLGHAGPNDRGPNGERQPLDLAGVFGNGWYDAERAAIRGRLMLRGPAAPAARAVARAYFDAYAAGEPAPDVGLSASLVLEHDGHRRVLAIAEVESLDVIGTRPARGGRFEAALAAMEDQSMVNRIRVALAQAPAPAQGDAAGAEARQIGSNGTTGDSAVAVTTTPAAPGQQPEGMRPALAQAPAVVDWSQVVGAAVQAALAPVQAELGTLRAALAAQAAPTVVQGVTATDGGVRAEGTAHPGRIAFGQTPIDQLQTAVDHLFGVRLPSGASFSRLRGIKDLYLFVTGDDEMRGVFQPERAQFANATSSTLNDLTKNALNKYVQQYFQDAYLWWEDVAEIVEFGTLQDPTWITMGGFGDLPTVSEGNAYTELTISDTSETSAWLKKGGYIGITLEAIDKDDTGKIAGIPRALAASAYRTLSAAVATIFTQSAGVGPTLADGAALFHATHGNLDTAALTSSSWEAAIQAMYKQVQLASARRLGARPERLLVPIELEATAAQIIGSNLTSDQNQINVRKGSAKVVVCPEFTDANDWVALADPMKNPAIGVGFRFGRVPEVFSDPGGQRMFTNDQLDLKARFFFTVGVIDYRAVLKRNVA